MLAAVLFSASLSLTIVGLTPPDAVVLWDWIISLPREYHFVGSFSPHIVTSLTIFCKGMEDSLDSSQDGVSLLPVSIYDTLIVFCITFGPLKGIGSSLLYHISCIALSLITRSRHANVYSRYILLPISSVLTTETPMVRFL